MDVKIKKNYLRLLDGTMQDVLVSVSDVEKDQVHLVSLNGFARASLGKNVNLDGEFGAGIDFEIDNVESWMANYRYTEFWCKPSFGISLKEVPDETQGFIYRKKKGGYGVVLPLVSEQYKCVLCGNPDGGLTAKLFSWCDDLCYCKAPAFLYGEGENPYALLKQLTRVGLDVLNNGCRSREERRYPEIFEYLGWCSWDAMQIRVCEKDLLRKCEEFKEKKIPVRWAILDDMWAEVRDFYDQPYQDRSEMFRLMHASKLYSFHADPQRFPNGLEGCIPKIKEYGMQVGIWHPTTGYWMGIDPEGDIYREQKENLLRTEDGRYIPHYEQGKAYAFYGAFHDYLRQCGADFVKIDNQSMTRRFYKKFAPVGQVSRSFHNGIEASVGQHFDNTMINCMGMASEDMWNRTVSPISRCSDDFQPENSTWFAKHVMQCSYNDLIQGQFYYCDWDMWWTDDGQALKNSVVRAISGGPIYVSDMMERSNREILMPLILEDGRILRCDRPAVPTMDCLTTDPTQSGKVFKLQNVCGEAGVMAVMNLDDENRTVTGTISPSEIDGLEGEEFAVYEHFSRELTILKKDESKEVTLKDIHDMRLYNIVPIRDGFAAIGRTDKFIAPKTICHVIGREVVLAEAGEYAVVEDGKLVIRQG